MMNYELVRALAFAAPAVCAFICMILILFDAFNPDKNRQERSLRLFLVLTCTVAMFCWTGLVLQVINPRAFVYYHTVFFFTLMMDQVLIYRFVHIITDTEPHKPFGRRHFLAPFFLTAIAAIIALYVPYEQQNAVIYGTGERQGGDSGLFAVFYPSTQIIFIIYNTLYPLLGFLRIQRYRHIIKNYSADTQRTSLNWLSVLLTLVLVTIPVPLAGMLWGLDVFNNFWTSIQGVLPTFIIYLILCYNLISDNYVIISPDDEEDDPDKDMQIDVKLFSKYIHEKKPYLNPKLKITDLCKGFGTNRSYMSAFINKEYGMNFSRFINRCRLEELDRQRTSSTGKERSAMELVLMAGFSSYQSYLRVKNEEYKESILKVN